MNSLAMIHIAKKQLSIDEDDFRGMCRRVTGKDSTRAMSEKERGMVVDHLKNAGFKPAFKGRSKPLEGQFAKVLQAFWISAWNLGIIRSREDKALIAFVKRQTHIDHVRFLKDAGEARKVIEALKSMMKREAGCFWVQDMDNGEIVALAQWDMLKNSFPFSAYDGLYAWKYGRPELDWNGVVRELGRHVRRLKNDG